MAAAQAAMEMSEALPNIFYDGYIYIYQFQPEHTHKIHYKQQKHQV